MLDTCSVCGITPTTPLKQCSRCKTGSYCGQKCQLEDWPNHKRYCATLAEALKQKPNTVATATATPVTANVVNEKNKSYEPDDTSEYKLQSYWDKRFEQEEEFDWLGKVCFRFHN